MILHLEEFGDFSRGLAALSKLGGTKAEYAEVIACMSQDGKDCWLEIRTGTDELSARWVVRNVTVEAFDERRPRFGINLGTVEQTISGKKGPGTIEVRPQTAIYKAGKLDATCANEDLRVRQSTPDSPAAPGKAKKTSAIGYYFNFPRPDELRSPFDVVQFKTAYDKIALEDQTKGVFSKGAFFGIRVEEESMRFVAYDTYHVGHMKVSLPARYEVGEDGIAADIVLTRNMAQKISRALEDNFRLYLGKGDSMDGNWIVCSNGELSISARTFEVRYNIAKVLKHFDKETTPLFSTKSVGDITSFAKRSGAAVITMVTRTKDVMFSAKSDRTKVQEPLEASVDTPGQELRISAKTLLDCCTSLKGEYAFSCSDRFIRMGNSEFEFIVVRHEE